ncbi:saccharopine dehydrogenase [Yoonia sediminilitoris]|uniref:Saccharopine dehydrogenase [NAD(+), L-lysine-forming] n=1 Tax=Yoonia sediminilitoris TaxID=1286148 RepID=A0A2T6KN29_9RHOB|nr:saccharopine dehydrogenase [Yoonia sediminilitoris]PUB17609.1 saccharopine dehydrogenase (NAD+, L-lysine-forming) [Yoonia sediminilitoris]RCW97904.1 saccharopine dehydrogenase (NAD+, L-lysine-forming) [Yoonia sediminilitoris]
MVHLWVRSEGRANEERVGLTPQGAAKLIRAGFRVTVEQSKQRILPIDGYVDAGCAIAEEFAWPHAPDDAIIFGLKELPDDGTPLRHRHIMFGHAYKGQPAGQVLLDRFKAGGGTLYDLEYLVDDEGRRVAAFGYWAGYAGAAVALMCWIAQQRGSVAGPVTAYRSATQMLADLQTRLTQLGTQRPTALIIGALGRVGTGGADLCQTMGVATTKWDMAETASGGPFPEILQHEIFLNCILARPGTPIFVPASAKVADRRLTVIGDIACDPDSDFSPIKVYDRTTTWDAPALRVHDQPALDVTAIDNLPSMLPAESSADFADQLLPHLLTLDRLEAGVWGRARTQFDRAVG